MVLSSMRTLVLGERVMSGTRGSLRLLAQGQVSFPRGAQSARQRLPFGVGSAFSPGFSMGTVLATAAMIVAASNLGCSSPGADRPPEVTPTSTVPVPSVDAPTARPGPDVAPSDTPAPTSSTAQTPSAEPKGPMMTKCVPGAYPTPCDPEGVPVCAVLFNPKIRCVTAPCPQGSHRDAVSRCEACALPHAVAFFEGKCETPGPVMAPPKS